MTLDERIERIDRVLVKHEEQDVFAERLNSILGALEKQTELSDKTTKGLADLKDRMDQHERLWQA